MDQQMLKESVDKTMVFLGKLVELNVSPESKKVIVCGWVQLEDGLQWRMYVINESELTPETVPGIKKDQRVCIIGSGPPGTGYVAALFEFDKDDTSNSLQFKYPLEISEEDLAVRIFSYLVNNVAERTTVEANLQ